MSGPEQQSRNPASRSEIPTCVLVRSVNWLGDIVMTLPALHAIRAAFPRAHLAVTVRRPLAPFFAGSGWIDEIIPIDVPGGVRRWRARVALVRALRRRRFDLAVLLPRSFESALWPFLAGIPRRAGFATDGRGPLLTHRTPYTPERYDGHQSHDYLRMLERTLGIHTAPDPVAPDVSERARVRMQEWLAANGHTGPSLVGLAVAAAYGPAKEWPGEHYASLIDRLADRYGIRCVLLGAPSERGRCEEVAARSRRGALIAAGETDLADVVALLSLCRGFVGNDSGPMHVAGALGIPTVGIFGSTEPARTAPRGPRVRVLYDRIECSPCRARTCRFGHYECLRRISPERVEQALIGLMGTGPIGPIGPIELDRSVR